MLCGGEEGKYSAIRLNDLELDVDSRLPLDLDPTSTQQMMNPIHNNRENVLSASGVRAHPTTSSTVGSEIVNCITIWTPMEGKSEKAYTIPVAVVSNNDCTISFLDLRDSEITETLTLPDCVNRSVMSPCGSMLASVCDDPFLYIHQRQPMSKAASEHMGSGTAQRYEWILSGRFQLQGQKKSDKDDLRGSFAICFSNSGRYLAVATQYGIISIFETSSLDGEYFSPHVFTTSRPGPEPGAVRSMAFSNGPYDLLVWTESKGRFCVADVRNMFLSRQLVTMDHKADDVERISVLDRDNDVVVDPRLRASGNDSSRNRIASDLLALEAERRQIRQLILDRYDPPPFTASETEVLHASQLARRQRDANGNASAVSAWSPWNEMPRSTTTSATQQGDTSRNERRISTTGLPPVLRDFVTSDRTASFRSFINERNRESERRSLSQQEAANRRNSAMLAAAEDALEQEVAQIETEATSNLERLTLEQTRLDQTRTRLEQARLVGSDSPNNPWADIDALYRSRYPAEPRLDRSARLRVELETERRQPWRAALSSAAALGRPEGLTPFAFGLGGRASSIAHPGETMGCCWSQDGKIL